MSFSRRSLLTASALVLARSAFPAPAPGRGPTPTPEPTPQSVASTKPILLCWNENPYGPSPAARLVISNLVAGSCRYPEDSDEQLLVEDIARLENTTPDHIVTGSGSGELLRALGMLNAGGGGVIVAAEPTYAELPDYARQAGAVLKFVPVDKQLRHDLSAMHAAVTPQTRAVYLCNPNNPTGTAMDANELRSFIEALPNHVTAIVDEAYMDFAAGAGIHSVADLVASDHPVVILRTFSKIHGMAGIRCGYAIARPDMAVKLAAARMTSPNIFAMRAARASLSDHAFLADCRRRIIAGRTRITTELAQLGMAYAQPQGNFVFFDTGVQLARFAEFMSAQNIVVGRLFAPYDRWCRITIGTEPEVDAFLGSLRRFARSAT